MPADHPLRPIRVLTDAVLAGLNERLAALYPQMGRPSIPPEMLLRATLLQAVFSVRSERMLMEQIDDNLLFRWFVGLEIDAPVWHPTVFTHNRDRLLETEVARAFLAGLLALKPVKRLLSSEHFSVDGTLIEAWASMKSFRPKDGPGEPPGPGRNGEREAALVMLDRRKGSCTGRHRITLGADKAYDVAAFVGELRARTVTPHIAVNGAVFKTGKVRSSRIDARTTRHIGYAISERCRKRIEEAFGWIKTQAGLRKVKLRGLPKVEALFTFAAAAYNLVRIPRLLIRQAA